MPRGNGDAYRAWWALPQPPCPISKGGGEVRSQGSNGRTIQIKLKLRTVAKQSSGVQLELIALHSARK